MTFFSYPIDARARLNRSLALAALMGGVMLVSPLNSARAGANTTSAVAVTQAAPKTQAGAAATATKGETVEKRITDLRAALKITPEQDAKWNAVAQAMRENAASMDKLIAESRTSAPKSMNAMDDLAMYQKFSQAHVDGLKNLISSFSSLYSVMPDAQKKLADGVFESSRHDGATAHG